MRGRQATWCYQAADRSFVGSSELATWWSYDSLGYWLRSEGLVLSPDHLLDAGLAEYTAHQTSIVTSTAVTEDLYLLDATVRLHEGIDGLGEWQPCDDWYYADDDFDFWTPPPEFDLEDWYGLDKRDAWHG